MARVNPSNATPRESITGVILAGGRAERMGGHDKGLLTLGGRTLVEHVLDALRPQVGRVVITANRNRERYAAFGCDVVADMHGGFLGPLAGMASGIQATTSQYVVTVPCDSPFIPDDLVARLHSALVDADAELSVVHDGVRLQPVFALLTRALSPSLLACLETGERRVQRWMVRHKMVEVPFVDRPHAFLNVNNPETHRALQRRLARVGV